MIDHFPDEIYPQSKLTIEEGGDRNARLQLSMKFNAEELATLDTSLKDKAIALYKADDSCLFIVNRYLRWTNHGFRNSPVESMRQPGGCAGDYLPVPNFWEVDKDLSELNSRLPESYIIYVLNSQKGVFMEGLNRNSGRFMPMGWRDGYSKGIALSEAEGEVIYWTVVW